MLLCWVSTTHSGNPPLQQKIVFLAHSVLAPAADTKADTAYQNGDYLDLEYQIFRNRLERF